MEPIIVRSPVYQDSTRDSTALDRRSVGSGIFQFREARASQQPLVNIIDEAPVPPPFATRSKEDLLSHSNLPVRSKELPKPSTILINSNGHPWSVYCNECDKAMSDAHYHCSICDGGDYDLCEECVASGKLCLGEGHWLIKRFVKDGRVVSSTTERISPRSARPSKPIKIEDLMHKPEEKKEMPGSFADDTKTLAEQPRIPTRTCNSCVVVLPERDFVTCTACDDFDLCVSCHTGNKHGHHPAHGFKAATHETALSLSAETMLAPGRNVRHNAICDGCDKKIYGVRHKCLSCPDWDFCSACAQDARHTHPRHRFAAIYNPIPDQFTTPVRHFGIYCDGPLCKNRNDQSYVTGVRYKCAVCHDMDFCASCEAFPGNHHNRTHPLIKFKTPVRNVSITTENEDLRGNVRMMGDRCAEQKSAGTETMPVPQANAATQVQTMAEIKPTEVKQEVLPIPVVASEEKKAVAADEPAAPVPSILLNAHFVQDSIPDGMAIQPTSRFTQIWTLKNPGPYAWPAGCSVRYIGGDNMLNVDNGHPSSVSDIAEATESNVVGREVQVGEEVAFKVVLKAPVRVGRSISYWRLKAADGTPFGHRLWCDVEVKAPEAPMPAPVKPAQPGQPMYSSPFEAAHKANALRMQQALLQQQRAAQYDQMMLKRQAQLKQHSEIIKQRQEQAAQKAQAQAFESRIGAPPAYEASEGLQARVMATRAEQRRQIDAMCRANNAPTQQAGPNTTAADVAKARKDAAKQRVEHIKAKIMRTREEQARKALEAQRAAAAEQKSADETEKVKKIIEEVSKSVEKDEPAMKEVEKNMDMEGSQMVFPKLEKESPASSTYQSAESSSIRGKPAYVETEEGEIERSASPSAAAVDTAAPPSEITTVASPVEWRRHDDEDFEVMSAEDSEEDDGFLTDEEYDILDASDQETVASP